MLAPQVILHTSTSMIFQPENAYAAPSYVFI